MFLLVYEKIKHGSSYREMTYEVVYRDVDQGGSLMKKCIVVSIMTVAVLALVTTAAFAGRSGNSHVWHSGFIMVDGKATVVVNEEKGEVCIQVNVEGEEPNRPIFVGATGGIYLGWYSTNNDGKLNVHGCGEVVSPFYNDCGYHVWLDNLSIYSIDSTDEPFCYYGE